MNRCSNCRYWRKRTKRMGHCMRVVFWVFNWKKAHDWERRVLTNMYDMCQLYEAKEAMR